MTVPEFNDIQTLLAFFDGLPVEALDETVGLAVERVRDRAFADLDFPQTTEAKQTLGLSHR